MNQSVVHLALHAGSVDPGGTGWHYGDAVAGREIHHLILGFNGGFKFSTGSGGFVSFDGDLRMAYACPQCRELVWVAGA